MADNLFINRRTSAMLVMDFQTLIVDNHAAGAEALLDRTAKLIAVARAAGMRVIYVVVGFRPGFPEERPKCDVHRRGYRTDRDFMCYPLIIPASVFL
jgi:nicotinamidase-related amidase